MDAAGAQRDMLIKRIDEVVFSTSRVRTSYDMGTVDDHLDQMIATVREGRDARADWAGVSFKTVRFTEGYSIDEVDTFLAEVTSDDAAWQGLARGDGAASAVAGGAAATGTDAEGAQAPGVPEKSAGRSRVATAEPGAPGAAAAKPATGSSSPRRGGLTMSDLLHDYLAARGMEMPDGSSAAHVAEEAAELVAETDAENPDVLKVAHEVADVVLAAAVVAEKYGFTVEEAIREKKMLDTGRSKPL